MVAFISVLTLCDREYVSSYWPNPETQGQQVCSMYYRIEASEKDLLGKDASPNTDVARANGQASSPGVKHE